MSSVRVFLTGGTGFVGGAVLFDLLRDPRVESVVALVRAHDADAARERLRRSLLRFGPLSERFDELRVVPGDLTTSGPVDARTVTHVLHAAACTSFRSRRELRAVNVDGTGALARLFCGGRRLERFLFVSTAYRCGRVEMPLVREETPASAEHAVEYTRTKADAEALLAGMPDLPLVVVRPSIVVGHTELGVGPSTSLFWYYCALAEAGIAPFPGSRRRDVVPVDYVAAATVHLLLSPRLQHGEYHVAAGPAGAFPWDAIRTAFGCPEPSLEVAPALLASHPIWQRLVGDSRRFRAALQLCARFASVQAECFSTDRLAATGMLPAKPFPDYVNRCLATAGGPLLELLNDDA